MPGPNFSAYYPLSAALGLLPVVTGDAEHPAADEDEVKDKLGAARFTALSKRLKQVLSCGHRKYDLGHTRPDVVDEHAEPIDLGGYEAHAIFFDDIEKFLAEESHA